MPLPCVTIIYARAADYEEAHGLLVRYLAQGFDAEIAHGAFTGVCVGKDKAVQSYSDARERLLALEARVKVGFKRLHPNAILPSAGSTGAAGLDLHACIDEPIVFEQGKTALIPTGWAFACPPGCYARIAPRSGMSNRGFFVNAGVVDADYRGEVKVMISYLDGTKGRTEILPGDRIAQVVFERCTLVQPLETAELNDSDRGAGGFGSTGR